MSEINNNITNYGYKIERISKNKETASQTPEPAKESNEKQYIADTGVLGRSQILNGANISKSVDEAVELAKNNPAKMGCSEAIFDSMFKKFLEEGLSESDAYLKALCAEEEFLQIS